MIGRCQVSNMPLGQQAPHDLDNNCVPASIDITITTTLLKPQVVQQSKHVNPSQPMPGCTQTT